MGFQEILSHIVNSGYLGHSLHKGATEWYFKGSRWFWFLT